MAKKNVLSIATRVKLADLIRAEYSASKLKDSEFAVVAAAKLGCPIDGRQVAQTRESVEVPSNVPPKAPPLEVRVEQLEAQLAEATAYAQGLREQLGGVLFRLDALESGLGVKPEVRVVLDRAPAGDVVQA